jgi:hypothetical protein
VGREKNVGPRDGGWSGGAVERWSGGAANSYIYRKDISSRLPALLLALIVPSPTANSNCE